MTNNLPTLQKLKESFDRVYQGLDELQQEYDLLKEAERLNIPLDAYRRLYKLRKEVSVEPFPQAKNWQQMLNKWLEWYKNIPTQKKLTIIGKIGVKLAESSVIVSIVFGVYHYVSEGSTRRKQVNYQAWQIINSATNQPTSGGRIDAIQDLNENKVSLENLNVQDAWLQKINLKEAKLARANFQGSHLQNAIFDKAELTNARLFGAELPDATLKQANLSKANLSRADLRKAHLRDANLQNANLQNADLQNADFRQVNFDKVKLEGANLKDANLQEVKNLDIQQLRLTHEWKKEKN